MYKLCLYTALSIGLFAVTSAAEPTASSTAFRFDPVTANSLGLWEGDKPVLVYNHGPITRTSKPAAEARRCYFHPVYGLDGEILTDDFPKDHSYHRGMYWAWPHIKINDQEYELWVARGPLRQEFSKWLHQDIDGGRAKLGIENSWLIGEKQVVREQVRLEIHSATENSRAIDIELSWTPINQPLTLSGAEGKSYGGFNFRFGPRTKTVITVPEGNVLADGITASAGRISGDLLVTRLPWADFVGDFQGAKGLSGATIFVHPRHPDFPPTWMTRHYGLVSVGWPGVNPQTIPAHETVVCRYRVWIHRGNPSADEIQQAYEIYHASQR